jgi:xylan 1,4-beta-xylosidase
MKSIIKSIVCLAVILGSVFSTVPCWSQNQNTIKNAVIPGFNPDPSICKAGDTYYVTTSSFQFWPGLPIYESKDLKNWKLIDYVLKETRQADLFRICNSGGIWAPDLTYNEKEKLFYIVYTIASGEGMLHETDNYVATSKSIHGPWSDPVYLNSRGNDPSMFHDDNGKHWFVCSDMVYEPGKASHQGMFMQEYDPKQKKLVGPHKNIFKGTDLGFFEGSKMFKRGDWYYLVAAEGGTNYGHAMTMARSKDIWGPYEVHPDNPVLTARDAYSMIKRAGHGDIQDISKDEAVVFYLAGRPVERNKTLYSTLGRESFIANAAWRNDGWLYLDNKAPQNEVPMLIKEKEHVSVGYNDEFNDKLSLHWNSLRVPIEAELIDLKSKPGSLLLKGTASNIYSFDYPSLLVQRVKHHQYKISTKLSFDPKEIQQRAGLVVYYDTRRWFFFNKKFDPVLGPCLAINSLYDKTQLIPLDVEGDVELEIQCDGYDFHFYYRDKNQKMVKVGTRDALWLSDEGLKERGPSNYNFTGTMMGIAVWDHTTYAPRAAFDYFHYEPNESWPAFVKNKEFFGPQEPTKNLKLYEKHFKKSD